MRSPLLLITLLLTIILSAAPAGATERLHYRLSYSGLLSGFFWKKLADVTLTLQPESVQFRGEHACRLTMEIDTSAYLFAETIHSVRYQWQSILSPDLQRTLLTRTIDTGISDIHEVTWYDWKSSTISLFRKRKPLDERQHPASAEATLQWEQNIYKPVPDFIQAPPPVEGNEGYLIQSQQFTNALTAPAIDPLAMIQRIRHHPFDLSAQSDQSNQPAKLTLLVALEEEFRDYHARLVARPDLKIGKQLYPSTHKISIKRASTSGRKGAMHLWLSDDPKHLLLRIDINAPLGMVHIELLRSEEDFETRECTSL
jgi:hypothetical protein